MSQKVIVSGPTGGAPNRLEIRDFIKNDKFFSLYIQALQAIQKEEQTATHPTSYFQIGGIHGLPYTVWNGVKPTAGWTWGGYCTHGSVLFPTWHRPYMSLYEQLIQDHAKRIAETYKVDLLGWKKAAEDLRQPYWDWAVHAVPPDEIIALKIINITTPNGKKTPVNNPLYNFAFHPIDPSFPSPYSIWHNTIRQPTTTGPDATDDVARIRAVLANSQGSLTAKTYNMLTRVHTWNAFSNHTVGDGGSGSNSLEAIHDGIHVMVGGNGHMGDPAVAGFDPIFFLHHTNVDRLISLWSAVNPGVWVSSNNSEDGTFTIPPNTTVDTNTPLTPFYNGQTTFWPSTATVDTRKLGYSYPEFNGLDLGNKDAVKLAIARKINQLYGAPVFGNSTPTNTLPGGVPAPQKPLSYDPTPPNRGPYEWTAHVETKQFEIPSSYLVGIFLGEIPKDPNEWQVCPNYVGAHYGFVNSVAQECENCRKQADVVIETYIHLNKSIVRHSGLKSLDPKGVVPYLTENLRWAVLKVNGEPVKLSSLEVVVHAAPLSYPEGTIFPVAGKNEPYHKITHGSDGGSRHGAH